MESQQFEYWHPHQSDAYTQPPQSSTYYDYTPDLASIPSLSASPTSTTFDVSTPAPPPQQQHTHQHRQLYQHPFALITDTNTLAYQLPVTPSDIGSADEAALPSPYCSPRRPSTDGLGYSLSPDSVGAAFPLHLAADHVHAQGQGGAWSGGVPTERTHTTNGRRRAQNRAAQRAFRERKEKHAKDLEVQLALLTERYGKLEASHTQLNSAYEKLHRTIELLTSSSDHAGTGCVKREGLGLDVAWARDKERVRKLVEILHGEVGVGVGREEVKCEG